MRNSILSFIWAVSAGFFILCVIPGCKERTAPIQDVNETILMKLQALKQGFFKEVQKGNYNKARTLCRNAVKYSKTETVKEYADYLYFLTFFMKGGQEEGDSASAVSALKRYLNKYSSGRYRSVAEGLLDLMRDYSARIEDCSEETEDLRERLEAEEACCGKLDSLTAEVQKLERVILKIERARVR